MNKADFIERAKPATRPFTIDGLEGFDFTIRALTGAQLDRIEKAIGNEADPLRLNLRGTVTAWTLCDEKGERLFDDGNAGDVGQLDGRVLQAVFDAALEHSGLTGEDLGA